MGVVGLHNLVFLFLLEQMILSMRYNSPAQKCWYDYADQDQTAVVGKVVVVDHT